MGCLTNKALSFNSNSICKIFGLNIFLKMQNYKVFTRLIYYRFISSYKNRGGETYYDILNVNKDSSNKEIRSAYVELTKKFHPDVSGNNSNSQFVKISEAYKVLSKSDLRAAYDRQLLVQLEPQASPPRTGFGTHTTEVHRPWEIKPDYNPKPGAYYGIRGIGRVSNSKIALILFVLGVFLSVIGFTSVSHSFSLHRDQYDRKSSEASSHHQSVRAEAQKYGNEEQLKRMANKILSRETGAAKKLEVNTTKQIESEFKRNI